MQIDILYEDDHYVIINKPSGLLSIPDRHNATIPSAAAWLRSRYPSIYILHRLDKETSGVLCFAKDEETHRYTSQLFEHRHLKKFYSGIVYGTLSIPEGRIEDPIMEHPVIKGKMMIHHKQGKPSVTDYKTLESFGLFSFMRFDIHSGRTHQIRIHMQNAGHPIVCDALYGKPDPVFISTLKHRYKLGKDEEEKPMLSRMALHASQIIFTDAQGKLIDVSAPLPKDMDALLKQCRKWLKK